jgi:two-component system, NarL family, sensor histidine kinase UhpB
VGVTLLVRDDGHGISEEQATGGTMGLGGMHERALLVAGRLTVRGCGDRGTEVRLDVPVREPA